MTKVDPVQHLRTKADRLEGSLYQSGDLVSLTFWVPSLQARKQQVQKQLAAIMTSYPDQFEKWSFSTDDKVSTLCRPDLVALVQSAFCCDITNQVPWGELLILGGSRQEVVCRLPDRSMVDLEACHKWLNESIAGGWMVGVTLQSDCPGHSEIVATRKRAEAEAQPSSPANGSLPVVH